MNIKGIYDVNLIILTQGKRQLLVSPLKDFDGVRIGGLVVYAYDDKPLQYIKISNKKYEHYVDKYLDEAYNVSSSKNSKESILEMLFGE